MHPGNIYKPYYVRAINFLYPLAVQGRQIHLDNHKRYAIDTTSRSLQYVEDTTTARVDLLVFQKSPTRYYIKGTVVTNGRINYVEVYLRNCQKHTAASKSSKFESDVIKGLADLNKTFLKLDQDCQKLHLELQSFITNASQIYEELLTVDNNLLDFKGLTT